MRQPGNGGQVRLHLFGVLAVHFLEQCGAPVTSWVKINRRRRIRLRTGGIGLAEFVLGIRIGKQLLVRFRPTVVKLNPAPVMEEKCIVLITRKEIGIRSKECIRFGRDLAGLGRLDARFEKENHDSK